MGFFSRLFGKRDHRDSRQGSNHYKREGIFSRLLGMVGSFSNSGRRYNNQYHDSNRRRYNTSYSDDSYRNNHSDRNYRRKRYRSSWS
ncbi:MULTISPECIES: hypothetical protein [Clostridium]|jgi:hypothetical protein|uniref:hypothetical protein n=1 Tax=Clostridium TaxID=1485 RepID=UPI0002885684|nr:MULTISPECIES: hypothetical protein [Clostridium]MDF2503769.1 hypothetical protein [Clostridium sp.]